MEISELTGYQVFTAADVDAIQTSEPAATMPSARSERLVRERASQRRRSLICVNTTGGKMP